jgi:hypothetical protein
MGFYAFVKTGIISVDCINQLIFIMETRCVFCDVETELLNIIYISSGLGGLRNSTFPLALKCHFIRNVT